MEGRRESWRETEIEADKRKRIERGGNARAYVCVKESGRLLERLSHYLG